jgi:diphthamide biosynthesis protein 7
MQSSLYDDVEGTRQIKSLHTLIFDKPPCCLEFLPNHRDYFIVGTYNLVKEGEDVSRSQLHYVEAKTELEVEEVEANNDEDEVKDSEKKPQRRDGSLILCKIVDGTM